jgi:hypothetical protein
MEDASSQIAVDIAFKILGRPHKRGTGMDLCLYILGYKV